MKIYVATIVIVTPHKILSETSVKAQHKLICQIDEWEIEHIDFRRTCAEEVDELERLPLKLDEVQLNGMPDRATRWAASLAAPSRDDRASG